MKYFKSSVPRVDLGFRNMPITEFIEYKRTCWKEQDPKPGYPHRLVRCTINEYWEMRRGI